MTFNSWQNVFHRRRCLFWTAWFVIIRHQKVLERTKRTCEQSPPDSSLFLADIARTLQGGTFGLCRACSSVQAISSELMVLIVFFLWASAIPQNSFPILPSTPLRRLHQQLEVFHQFPNVLLQHQIFLLQCCCRTISAPRVVWCVSSDVPVSYSSPGLVPGAHSASSATKRTSWVSSGIADPPLGLPIGNIRDPTSGPPDTSWIHACQIQDYPMPLVSTAACGVPLWTESSVPSCGSRLLEHSALGPCPQVDSCSFLRDPREAVPVHLLLIKAGLWSRSSIPLPALPDGVVPLPAVPSIEGIRPSWDCRHPIVTWETGSSHRTGEDTRSLMECGIEPSDCRASVIGDVEPACMWSVVTCPGCWLGSVSLIRLLCSDSSRHRFFSS